MTRKEREGLYPETIAFKRRPEKEAVPRCKGRKDFRRTDGACTGSRRKDVIVQFMGDPLSRLEPQGHEKQTRKAFFLSVQYSAYFRAQALTDCQHYFAAMAIWSHRVEHRFILIARRSRKKTRESRKGLRGSGLVS